MIAGPRVDAAPGGPYPTRMSRSLQPLRTACLAVALAWLGGCGKSTPQPPEPPVATFPVVGKVVYKGDGDDIERLERGEVWFQSTTDPKLQALGRLSDDGSFRMTMLLDDKTYAGVPAGTYKVCVLPPLDEERQPKRNLLAAKYTDPDRSGLKVTVPVEGEITLEVERPRR